MTDRCTWLVCVALHQPATTGQGGDLPLRLRHADPLLPHALQEPALLVRAPVPGIHPRQLRLALPDGQHRSSGDDVEVVVRDDRGDLEQDILRRVQPRHLAIDPYQMLLASFRPCHRAAHSIG